MSHFLLNLNGVTSKILKYPSIFREKNCKDLGIGQDFKEFAKIPTLESLIFFFIYKFFKKGGIFEILKEFNGKY
jgi:hypothetical protein